MTRAKTTDPFYMPCVICATEVGIEIGYESGSAPDGMKRNVRVEESVIVDLKCPHALEVDAWLATDEGYRWACSRLEEYPGPARRLA